MVTLGFYFTETLFLYVADANVVPFPLFNFSLIHPFLQIANESSRMNIWNGRREAYLQGQARLFISSSC
jgi:hypothetical protein